MNKAISHMESEVSLPYKLVTYLFELVTHKFYITFKDKNPNLKMPIGITNILGAQANRDYWYYADACWCVEKDPEVKKFLDDLKLENTYINPKIAFDIFSDHKGKIKEDQNILLKDQYKAFLIYVGYKSAQEFIDDCYTHLEYKGLYYSYSDHGVKEFSFSVTLFNTDFTQKIVENKNESEVVVNIPKTLLKGFHNHKRHASLTGTLSSFQDCWHTRVKDDSSFLDITIHVGANVEKTLDAFKHSEILNGHLNGTASDHSLYSGEIILIKKEADPSLIVEAKKFLNLRHNRFAANGDTFYLNNEFKIKGTSIDKIKDLSDKKYRLITAAPDGFYFQSVFKILPDYSAEIIVPHFHEKHPNKLEHQVSRRQLCRLSFENIEKNRLLIFGIGKGDVLYSTTVINIPENLNDLEHTILKGAFCIMDQKAGLAPTGNIFLMMMDDSDFSPKIFNRDIALSFEKSSCERILVDALQEYFNKWLLGWGIIPQTVTEK